MDKTLLKTLVDSIKSKGLKSEAVDILESKTPKVLYAAFPTGFRYSQGDYDHRRDAEFASGRFNAYSSWGGSRSTKVYTNPAEAIQKAFDDLNWSSRSPFQTINGLFVLKLSPKAFYGEYGEWIIGQKNMLTQNEVLDVQFIPIEKNKNDIFVMDLDDLEEYGLTSEEEEKFWEGAIVPDEEDEEDEED